MSGKWTPGPWSLEITTGTGAAADCTVAMIEQSDQGPYRGMIARLQSAEHIDGIDAAELTSNAHLLLAAPDMYAALGPLEAVAIDRSVDAPEWRDRDTVSVLLSIEELRAARAALAKARGEAK